MDASSQWRCVRAPRLPAPLGPSAPVGSAACSTGASPTKCSCRGVSRSAPATTRLGVTSRHCDRNRTCRVKGLKGL